VSLLFIRESYRPLLLARKLKRLQMERPDAILVSAIPYSHSGAQAVQRSLVRPIKLLIFSPIVLLPSFGLALIFGLLVLMISTMTIVFQRQYNFSTGSAGLAYLGFGVGLILANFVFAFTSDRTYKTLAKFGTPKPEIRLAPITLGAPLACFGLLIYGWGAEKKVHWMLPITGAAIYGASMIAFIMPVTTYLIEVFRQFAASAVGANAFLRSLVGGLLPLCAGRLYARLGLGWGNTLLAFIILVFTPLPILFYKNGEKLRSKFPIKP
jgi:MFS family permease